MCLSFLIYGFMYRSRTVLFNWSFLHSHTVPRNLTSVKKRGEECFLKSVCCMFKTARHSCASLTHVSIFRIYFLLCHRVWWFRSELSHLWQSFRVSCGDILQRKARWNVTYQSNLYAPCICISVFLRTSSNRVSYCAVAEYVPLLHMNAKLLYHFEAVSDLFIFCWLGSLKVFDGRNVIKKRVNI